MGKDIPLARSEDDREPASPVLLVKAGSGVSSSASSYRDKRQKKYGFASRTKSSKTKDTAKEGKNNTGNSRGDRQASASSKHRQDNKTGQSTRELEGTDSTTGRSAKDLAIEWIGSYCDSGSPHHLIEIAKVDEGALFRCKYCMKIKWLPTHMEVAVTMGIKLGQAGGSIEEKNKIYQQVLDRHPVARRMVWRYQNLYLLKRVLSNDDYLQAVVALAIMKED